ncbi:MAG TPA: ABC transporter permease [Vicinamibacterales bacterium]|nr:ABC transporter permease [Vicinamibacterales bacterium]
MSPLFQDIRYAIRTLRRSYALTLVIVASLAIGIGANTAIFSVVNALLLKPLPYPDADRLAILWLRSPGVNIPQDWPSPGQYLDVQQQNHAFAEMAIAQGRVGTMLATAADSANGQSEPQRVEALLTSSSLFPLLGAKPIFGRLLRPEEDAGPTAQVVVLSHAFWRRAFGADPNVVGRTITLNGLAQNPGESNQFQVIGVLGSDFLMNGEIIPTVSSTTRMDVYLPLPFGPETQTKRRGDENFNILARLKPGVTMAQAKSDVAGIAAKIREVDKRDRTFTIDVVPLVDSVVGNVRLAVLVVMGSVTLVLLIACANVANLLLTRATGRQKEVAVRTALGASWQRLVRQLLTESLLLGLLGGVMGLLVARTALQVVRTMNPGNIPRLDAIALDASVLTFTFAVSVVTGLLFGLAPAVRAARVDLSASMKAGGRSSQGDGGFGSSRRRLRSLLVVSEVAISLMLLVGAGLLIRSFVRLQHVAPGFDPEGVVSMRLGASARQFQNRDAALGFYRPFNEALAVVPGVVARGAVTSLPFTSSVGWGGINVEGWTPAPGQELQVDQRGATTDYFRAMKIPVIQGRVFSDADLPQNAEPVCVIDEKFAQRFWPNGDAVGKHLWNGDPGATKYAIVGVVGTVKQYGLDVDGRIVMYRPSLNGSWHVARTTGDPTIVAAALVRKIHELDPTMTVVDVQTMTDRMSGSMARQRFSTVMLGAFAGFALLLAIVGVYGVMSHLVAQGARDIGVRMALGAERRRILSMVLRQGLELAGAGTVIGLLGAAALTRVMAGLLFDVSTTDATTFAIVPAVLIATAMLATCIPALRATRVDPVVALRDE